MLKRFFSSPHRWAILAGLIVVVAAAAMGAARLTRKAPNVPTAEVRLGEFVDNIELRGEVKAVKSIVLTAPSNAGDIQIVQLAKNGSTVKKGDTVVRFDTMNVLRTLDQRRSELKEAEAEIERSRAQARLKEEEDLTTLQRAQYDVERAKLDASKEEFISRLDAEKNKLILANFEQFRREAEQRLVSNRAATTADIESRKHKREKALFDVRQAERNLAAMTIVAPADGMFSLLPNFRARGFFGGGSVPEFREGDRAWPGAAIAELPDLTTVRMNARIEEIDRSRLKVNQTGTVRVDALADKELGGQVSDISALAKPDFSGWPPVKNFDVTVRITQTDARLRPGMSATARVAVERVPDSILIPGEAVFQKAGRSVVYVLKGSAFEEHTVQVARRSKTQVAIASGLKPGERVALKDPALAEAPR